MNRKSMCIIAGCIVAVATLAVVLLAGQGSSAAEVPTIVSEYVETLKAKLADAGVNALSVTASAPDAKTASLAGQSGGADGQLPFITIRVPTAVLEGSDSVVLEMTASQQAAFAVRDGIPLEYIAIVGVDQTGTEILESCSYIADLAPPSDWRAQRTYSLGAIESQMVMVTADSIAQTGVRVERTSVSENEYGRVVTVFASQVKSAGLLPGDFATAVDSAARAMNMSKGSGIMTLIVKLVAPDGSDVACYVFDYTSGGGSFGAWITPSHRQDPAFKAWWMK